MNANILSRRPRYKVPKPIAILIATILFTFLIGFLLGAALHRLLRV